MTECCANCRHCVSTPKNNRYGDMEHFCISMGYFVHWIYKDRNKFRHLTPGGRELTCDYEYDSSKPEYGCCKAGGKIWNRK